METKGQPEIHRHPTFDREKQNLPPFCRALFSEAVDTPTSLSKFLFCYAQCLTEPVELAVNQDASINQSHFRTPVTNYYGVV